MTGTNVNDVRGVLAGFTSAKVPSTAAVGSAGNTSFRDVWDKQTTGNADYTKQNAGQQGTKTVKAEKEPYSAANESQTNKPGDSLKIREENGGMEKTNETGELSQEELEAAMEVLGSAAAEFLQQVADVLGLSAEELSSMLDQLGMDELDLLQPEGLTKLVMAVGGEEDMMSLLTNGEMYDNLQELTSQLKDVLDQCGQEMQMDPQQLKKLLDAQTEKHQEPTVVLQDEAPEIMVTIQNPEAPEEAENTNGNVQENASLNGDGAETAVQENTLRTVDQKQSGHGQKEKSDDKGSQGNAFQQNLNAVTGKETTQQVEDAAPLWKADTEAIMKQIMDYMKIQIKPDMSSLEMQLHPESLGTLHVQIASKGGALTAQFVTENETVKAVLESQMVQLKENFDQQGVKVEAIEVMVQTHEFERNLDQGRGQQQEDAPKKGRTRKIDLSALAGAEEISEEEQIAVDLMTANGNTVDYTA